MMSEANRPTTHALPMAGNLTVVVPGDATLITPYVLIEQRDWFETEIKFLRKWLKPGMRTMDIGANYGLYTLTMAKGIGPQGKQIAVEPTPNTAACLRESLAHNHFENTTLVECALSNRAGNAVLQMMSNSELNTLAESEKTGEDSIEVTVNTLDAVAAPLDGVDFIKLDAEGEEERIIEGGLQTLRASSPLIMFEVKHGTSVNHSLLSTFQRLEYGLYRLIPGLDLLAPFDIAVDLDSHLLNLFACDSKRAQRLSEEGVLVPSDVSDVSLPPASAASEATSAKALPYFHELGANWANAAKVAGSQHHDLALVDHGLAHATDDFGANERYALLLRALHHINEAIDVLETIPRLLTLARIRAELGQQDQAVKTLDRLVELLEKGSANLTEPFLSPSPEFDPIVPGNAVSSWCLSAVLTQRELLGHYSTYYTGAKSVPRLERLMSLGFASPEMQRRLILAKSHQPQDA